MNGEPSTFLFCPTYQVNGIDQVHVRTLQSIYNMEGDFAFRLGRYNPYNVRHLNILNQYRTGRRLFLECNYTHFMTVEHDMIVPPDALGKLLAVGAPVVYGLYMFRHNSQAVNAYTLPTGRNPGTSLSHYPDLLKRAAEEVTPEVGGAGFGCMLVERHVLENLDFHGKQGADSCIPDVEFALDCYAAGYKQICHFGVKCGHIDQDGTVLYPQI